MTYDETCTQYINQYKAIALQSYSALTGRDPEWASFNGTFGGKNATHLTKPIEQYGTFEEYMCDWLDLVLHDYNNRVSCGSLAGSSAERIVRCLKNLNLRNYVMTFMARTFFKTTSIAANNLGHAPYLQNLTNRFSYIDNL